MVTLLQKKILLKSNNKDILESLSLTKHNGNYFVEIKESFREMALSLINQSPALIIIDITDSEPSNSCIGDFIHQIKAIAPLIIIGDENSKIKKRLDESFLFIPWPAKCLYPIIEKMLQLPGCTTCNCSSL